MTKPLGSLIADQIVANGFALIPQAFPNRLITDLRACANERRADFKAARVGRASSTTRDDRVRSDEILWLEPDDLRRPEAELFSIFENLKLALNRELFLGLRDFEAHYARYDAGHFYQRHFDRFQSSAGASAGAAAGTDTGEKRGQLQRVISVVLYLNENWQATDGGQLRLALDPPVEIDPLAGTLVAFQSSEIEHEVLTSNRERLSIAAWFRRIET